MQAGNPKEPIENGGSQWPVSSILLYGTFGGRSAAERRCHKRLGFALAALVCWMLIVMRPPLFLPREVLRGVAAFAPGLILLYLCWEFRRYLLTLDELAKSIHMESIAWTYLTGSVIAAVLGGFTILHGWSINPLLIVLLEPIRVVWLYVVSRRY